MLPQISRLGRLIIVRIYIVHVYICTSMVGPSFRWSFWRVFQSKKQEKHQKKMTPCLVCLTFKHRHHTNVWGWCMDCHTAMIDHHLPDRSLSTIAPPRQATLTLGLPNILNASGPHCCHRCHRCHCCHWWHTGAQRSLWLFLRRYYTDLYWCTGILVRRTLVG